MKISDLLSPEDVMIDVRAPNKRLLLQELAAKAAVSLALQLPFLKISESMGNHDSKIVDAGRVD